MTRQIPKSVTDVEFPRLWRSSRRFIANGLRIVKKRKNGNHFAGGPAAHKGSKCPNCKKNLTLIWDLDLQDKLIPGYVREGFSPAGRLPFYICWRCMAASYLIAANDQMKCFNFDRHTESLQEDESPFLDSPIELPHRNIAFETIPTTIDALLTLEEIVELETFDSPARKTINEYYKQDINSTWELPFSQFGGQPFICQRHSNMVCPNPRCPASRLKPPYGEFVIPYLMKEMAVIGHDLEPELAKHYFQLLYYICGICFSIRAEYRCS